MSSAGASAVRRAGPPVPTSVRRKPVRCPAPAGPPARVPLGVPDPELLSRLAQGDADAFAVMVREYAPAARRLARLVLRNDSDADDAVQDALLSAWRAIRRYDPRRPFRPWLMRIVLNAARDLWRRRQVRDAMPLADPAATAGNPERHAARALLRVRLDQGLAKLSERARIALTLFDAEGYSHAEIAELLGIPEGTVRSDVFHARRALRRDLAPFLEEVS